MTKAQDIQQALAADIVRGLIVPGSTLDEAGLAAQFGVSRTPIREAIRVLQMSGLVDVRPHRGAVVTDLSDEQLDDMFSVMAELEALCARWSAVAMGGGERQALRRLHDASTMLVDDAERPRYVEANDRFHDAIYAGAHSPFLAETTRHVRRRLAPFRRAQFEGPARLARSHAEHEAIVHAIERGDAGAADAAMRRHIGVVRNAVDRLKQAAPTLRKRRARSVQDC